MEQVYEEPCDIRWFQSELDKLTRNTGESLRIVWAPKQVLARVVNAGTGESLGYRPEDTRTREYAKYPVRFGDFVDFVRGQKYYRRVDLESKSQWVEIAYQKAGTVIPEGVLLTDIAVPDIAHVNPSIHIFVIERRLPDHLAKPTHEQKRILSIINTGIDLFGAFPDEGIWDFFDEISEHRHVSESDTCCSIAAQHEVVCQGLYREPNQSDIERVRQSLAIWMERKRANMKPVVDQAARDLTEKMKQWEWNAKREIFLDLQECNKLNEIAQGRTRVVGGVNPPRHRKAY